MITTLVFFLFISVALLASFASIGLRETKASRVDMRAKQSWFLAEAGLEDALYRVLTEKNLDSQETISLDGFAVTTTITDANGTKDIRAAGNVSSAIRLVRSVVRLGKTSSSFSYGIQLGNGGLDMGQNSAVNGSVFSNGSVTGANGAQITGNAELAGSSTITGVSVGGTTQTGLAPRSLPISDAVISQWKDDAASLGTISSGTCSQDWSPPTTPYTLPGGVLAQTLVLNNNQTLILEGTVWVKCNADISNGSTIRLSPAYGSRSGLLIADGWIHLQNNGQFSGSGTAGSYLMLLSTASGGGHHGSAIDLHNNAAGAIFYAGSGLIHLHQNVAATALSADRVELENNASITYESALSTLTFAMKASGGGDIRRWEEIP